MRKSTVCFLLRREPVLRRKQVLLAPRRDGTGMGNLSGYGGKIDGEETPVEALVRELAEESTLRVEARDLTQVAMVTTFTAEAPAFQIHVFTGWKWVGTPKVTSEMGESQWFFFNRLPFDRMWAGDRLWLPDILIGKTFEADVHLDERSELTRDVVYRPRTFVPELA